MPTKVYFYFRQRQEYAISIDRIVYVDRNAFLHQYKTGFLRISEEYAIVGVRV